MILPIGKLKNLVEEAVDYRETPAVDAVFAELDALYAHIKELSHAIAYEDGVKAHNGYVSQMLDEDALLSRKDNETL